MSELCHYCKKTEARHPGMIIEGIYVPFCDSNEHTVFTPEITNDHTEYDPKDNGNQGS